MRIEGARILVTGAAGGIGSAVARRLGGSGAELLLADLAEAPLRRVAEQLACDGVCAATSVANIASEDGRKLLAARARDARINVLVNVAGINPFGPFEQQSAEDLGLTMHVNALAPILLCRALMEVLKDQAPSHIVNVGSIFGSIAYPGFAVYSASKFAVRGFSEALRRELADTGIRVHYVAPRATRTALMTDRIRAMNEELNVGMDVPEVVAAAIENVLETERAERFLGLRERLLVKVNALLPALLDRALLKQLPVIRRYAAEASRQAPRLGAAPPAAGPQVESPFALVNEVDNEE